MIESDMKLAEKELLIKDNIKWLMY
jgi:hypothetical protein